MRTVMPDGDNGKQSRLNAIWQNDVLGRRSDADFLLRFLIGRNDERRAIKPPASYVLNLNAPWGTGKTFFLDRFASTLACEGHVVASVNAWRDDHAVDPLLSVMAGIETITEKDIKITAATKNLSKKLGKVSGQIAAAGAKGLIRHAAKRLLDTQAINEIVEAAGEVGKDVLEQASKTAEKLWDKQAEKMLGDFKQSQRTSEQFKDGLRNFVRALRSENRAPLFVLIDELDRCRPSYAVALLERIKHLFDVDDVIFVVATDTEQLQHAVSVIYGAGFDSKRYLNRFFDTSYTFDSPSYDAFVGMLIEERPIPSTKLSFPPGANFKTYFSQAMEDFGLPLRDIQQTYELVANVATVWDHKMPIETCVLVPLAIGHVRNIPLEFSTRFGDELAKLEKAPGKWTVTFHRHRQESQTVSGIGLFKLFVRFGGRVLQDLYDEQSDDSANAWIVRTLLDEFSAIHARSRTATSIVRTYPALIQSAGRLRSEIALGTQT